MTAVPKTTKAEGPLTEEMRQLLLRAQEGDQAVLPALRQLFDGRPELWREFGNVAGHARDALVALGSGKSLLARESILRRMEELEAELAGPSASPLEKLLAERIAICWLQSYLADLDAVHKDRAETRQACHAQRRASASQGRYLSAIRQLALVRKLLRVSVTPLQLLKVPVEETGTTKGGYGQNSRSTGGRDAMRSGLQGRTRRPPAPDCPSAKLACGLSGRNAYLLVILRAFSADGKYAKSSARFGVLSE